MEIKAKHVKMGKAFLQSLQARYGPEAFEKILGFVEICRDYVPYLDLEARQKAADLYQVLSQHTVEHLRQDEALLAQLGYFFTDEEVVHQVQGALGTTTVGDLEIRIFPCQDLGYPVHIRRNEIQGLPKGYLPAGSVPWAPGDDPLADGDKLLDCLLADPVLRDAWREARARTPKHRVRLWIDPDASDLHTIPWERLRDRGVLLAASDATPFSRYVPVAPPVRPEVEHPVRVLAAVAAPQDLDDYGFTPLDVASEQARLKKVFAPFPNDQVEWAFLNPPVTLERLADALRGGCHVLHLMSHGAYVSTPHQKATLLYLEDDARNKQDVTAAQLAQMFTHQDHDVRLVVCAACHRTTGMGFNPLGLRLVQSDIPAVVVMQDRLSLPTARAFSRVFYPALLESGCVDAALNTARNALLNMGSAEVAVPVLFTSRKRGRLWASLEEVAAEREAWRRLDDMAALYGEATPRTLQDMVAWARRDGVDDPRGQLWIEKVSAFLAEGKRLEDLRRNRSFLINLGLLLGVGAAGAGGVALGRWLEQRPEAAEAASALAEEQSGAGQRPHPRSWKPYLIRIPAGDFLMGSARGDQDARDDEKPQHRVYLPEYYIGKTPVTNAQYRAFVQAMDHHVPSHWKNGHIPPGKEDHPVVYVLWEDAVAYCDWLAEETGQPYRLPTEAEWEKAARGTDGRIYPWGNAAPTAELCNFSNNVGDTTPVGSYPLGKSPYGCLDMAGNVWEWVQDWYQHDYYEHSPRKSPPGPAREYKVVRGGAYWVEARSARCASRGRGRNWRPWLGYDRVGVRVCVAAPFSPRSGSFDYAQDKL